MLGGLEGTLRLGTLGGFGGVGEGRGEGGGWRGVMQEQALIRG